jgi:hypothetical protein
MAKPQPPDSPKLWTVADISKHTGVGIGDINQAIKEGHIPKAGKATYEPGRAIKGLFAFFTTHRRELPVYDNVEQCSGATGIPVSLIKAIRRTSKEPFKNQRIHLGPLLREIFSNTGDGEDGINWKGVKEKADAQYSQARTSQLLGLTLDKNEVSAELARAMSPLWSDLELIAEQEGPADLVGRTNLSIQEWLMSRFDRLKAGFFESLGQTAAAVENDPKPDTATNPSRS